MRKLYRELTTARAVQEPRRKGSNPHRKDQLVPRKSMPSAKRSKFKSSSSNSITVDFSTQLTNWEQPEAIESSTNGKALKKTHAAVTTPTKETTNFFSNTFNPFDLGWGDDGEDISISWNTNESKVHHFGDGCDLFENSFSPCSDTENSDFSHWTQSTADLTPSPQKNKNRSPFLDGCSATNISKELSSKSPAASIDSSHIKGVSFLDNSMDGSGGRESEKLHINKDKVNAYFPFEEVSCGSSLSSSNHHSWDSGTKERGDSTMRLLFQSKCSDGIHSKRLLSPKKFPVQYSKRDFQKHSPPLQSATKPELSFKDQQLPCKATGKECQDPQEKVQTDITSRATSYTQKDHYKLRNEQFSLLQKSQSPIFTHKSSESSPSAAQPPGQAISQVAGSPGKKKSYFRVPSADDRNPTVVSKGKLAGTTLASVMERRRKITDGLCSTETKSATVDMAPKDCLRFSQVSARSKQNVCDNQGKTQDQISATALNCDDDLLSVPEIDQNHVPEPIPERKTEYAHSSALQRKSVINPEHSSDSSDCNENPVPNSYSTAGTKHATPPNEVEQTIVKFCPEFKESHTKGKNPGQGANCAEEKYQEHDQTKTPEPDTDMTKVTENAPLTADPADVALDCLPKTPVKLNSPPENENNKILQASKAHNTAELLKDKFPPPSKKSPVPVDKLPTNVTNTHTPKEERDFKDFRPEVDQIDPKYLRMIKVGLPIGAVKNALQRDGKDPSIFVKNKSVLDSINESSDVESTDELCHAKDTDSIKQDTALKDDPKYAKYFRMLKLGLPIGAVKNAMERDGMNPAVLDGDHDISAEKSASITTKALLCQSKPKDTHRRTRLYWDTLNEVRPHSVWAMVEQDQDVRQLCINDDEFARFFQAELASCSRQTSQKAVRGAPKGVVKVIDPQRANNGGIILARLKMSYDSMAKAIDCIDEAAVALDQIQGVMEYVPTAEEKKALRSYMVQPGGDFASKFGTLCECEKFMVTMMNVKHSKRKIRALLFKLQLNSNIKEIEKDVATVEKACEELSSSVRLRKVLGVILNIGNRLNTAGQTQKAEAQAFTIQSLLKLNQVKAFDRKTTLLQYIVMVIHRNNDLILRFRDELPTVLKADRIYWNQCLTDLQKLEIEIVNTRKIALHQALKGTNEKGNVIDESDSMSEMSLSLQLEMDILRSTKQGQFTIYAFEKLSMLRDNVERTKRKFAALLEYFGEESKGKMQPHELFQIINTFCKDVDAAMEEVSKAEKAKEANLKGNKDSYQGNEGSIKVPIQHVMGTIQSQTELKRSVQYTSRTNAGNVTDSKNKSIGKFIWRRKK